MTGRAVLVPTGYCGSCGCQVPVVRTGETAKHWQRYADIGPGPHVVVRHRLCRGSGTRAALILPETI